MRPTIHHGDHARLGEPGADGSHAVQYVAPDRSHAVAFQWRVGPATTRTAPALRLHGLDHDALYRVTDDTDPDGPHTLFSGAALMARGIDPDLPAGPFSSRMLTFTREPLLP
ncbi:GH36 C-terminal domain-containing protein [Kitasatospora arboriphila]